MSNILHRTRRALLAICLTLGASFAAQAAYSNVYFFGDSLSDTGNVYTASGGLEPPPPYFDGRFSNGPLWVEYLAAGLGQANAATPFLLGGNNYAWAGALTNNSGLADGLLGFSTGLQAQVGGFWAANHATANADDLFVIAIGGNDLFGIASTFPGAGDAAMRLLAAQQVVANLLGSLTYLIDHGARNFLIANAPNLGVTPAANGINEAATDVSVQYNALLAAALGTLNSDVAVTGLDLFSLVTALVADAANGGATYGLTDGVTPCIVSGLANCDTSVFFDPMHPTAVVHAMAGEAALALLAANQVPEPATGLLLAGALLLLVVRRQRTARPFGAPAAC